MGDESDLLDELAVKDRISKVEEVSRASKAELADKLAQVMNVHEGVLKELRKLDLPDKLDQVLRGYAPDLLGEAAKMGKSFQAAGIESATPFAMPFDPPRPAIFADTMYERIVSAIEQFEAELAPDEEIGVQLANFGNNVIVTIEDIGYHNPYLLKIYGVTSNGHRCTLLQHMSQANILLVALKAKDGHGRRIGFKLHSKVSEE